MLQHCAGLRAVAVLRGSMPGDDLSHQGRWGLCRTAVLELELVGWLVWISAEEIIWRCSMLFNG